MILKTTYNDFFEVDFEIDFYNTKEYILFHNPSQFYGFGVENSNGQINCFIYLFVIDQCLVSPYLAPFGGIEHRIDVLESEIQLLTAGIFQFCRTNKYLSLEIKERPFLYQSNALQRFYATQTFLMGVDDLNQQISTIEEIKIKTYNQTRLDKSLEKGFYTKVNPAISIETIYYFIKSARDRKKFPLTISLVQLQNMVHTFPERYTLFVTFWENQIASVAFGVRVNTHTLYYYLSADHEDFLSDSPIQNTLTEMYQFCKSNQINQFDLGISSVNGVENKGLSLFKKNMGAFRSIKTTYRLDLQK